MATHSSILAWEIPWMDSSWDHKESDMIEQLSTNRNKVAKYDLVSITLGVTSTKREQKATNG